MRTDWPSLVSAPWMEADRSEQWTRQQGLGEFLHVGVTGRVANPQARVVSLLATGSLVEFPLRDYQEECVLAVERSYRTKKRSPLIVLPTGAGKTIVASALIQRSFSHWADFRGYRNTLASRALFIAHRKELLDQTAEKLRFVAPNLRAGIVQGPRNDMDRDVVIASIDTLAQPVRFAELVRNGPFHLAVADECHHAVSTKWRKVIDKLRESFPDILLLGMTATPGREDGTALDLVFDDLCFQRSLLDMIANGALVPPRFFRVPVDIDLDKIPRRDGDWVTAPLSQLMNTPPVRQAVVQAWQQHGHDRKMLAFSVDINHARDLAQTFCDEGYPAASIDSKMKSKERADVIRQFRTGAIKLLVSCEVLIEGFDEPSAEGVILARPTQSQALLLQTIGRGLRPFPPGGKTDCLVIDIVGNTEKHKLVQLATLVGLDPELRLKGRANDSEIVEEEEGPGVASATLGTMREVSLLPRASKYTWRDTQFGLVLQIPRIGYYLVGPYEGIPNKVGIRFYDRRAGREDTPPRSVLGPIEYGFAISMVEAEMDRMLRALAGRKDSIDAAPAPISGLVDLDEGELDEQLDFSDTLVLDDQAWHKKPVTEKQRELLLDLGVKEKSLPTTAGDAAELIDIVRAERDMKQRLPATHKQLAYLRAFKLSLPEGTTLATLTKVQASRLIVQHKYSEHRSRA